MIKSAIAYQRRDLVIVHASSRTTAGVWTLSSPVLSSGLDDLMQMSQNLKEALAGSISSVPHQKSRKGAFDPILNAAGVKSWATFVKSAKCVDVELDNNLVSFIPTRNLGAKEGFEAIQSEILRANVSDELGSTLVNAFKKSE